MTNHDKQVISQTTFKKRKESRRTMEQLNSR
jgi:hypothetical protein